MSVGAVADVACDHCGLPVPPSLVAASGASFCCEGCRSVWQVLHGCGLEQYYALRDRAGGAPELGSPSLGRAAAHAMFDDEAFAAEHVTVRPDGLHSVELYLVRVHCAACVWLVERLPRVVSGVREARLAIGRQTAVIVWDPTLVPLSDIAAGLDRLGYPPHPARDRQVRDHRRREDRRTLIGIGVAGAIAGNVMLMAFALYGGHLHGMGASHRIIFGVVSAVLTGISLAGPGRVFYRGALASIRLRRAHMDLPVAVGLAAGYTWSVAATARGSIDVYYDSIAVLVFLLLLGRWIQSRQQRRGHDAVQLLFAVAPSTARRIVRRGPSPMVNDVPLEAVNPGDELEVRTGETIPVDGTVLTGSSQVDEALLTGESRPIDVAPGQPVHAGTVNLRSRIEVVATATGAATRAGRIMELVERSGRDAAPIVRRADRIAGIFVPIVLAMSALTAAIWWPHDPSRAIGHAMSLLIITCPCALGLATPLAVIAALGQAARRRILIKGGEALETLARPGFLVLDKTGTLTAGRRAMVRWTGSRADLELAAALESGSGHPVARAIVRAAAGDFGEANHGGAAALAIATTPATATSPFPATPRRDETLALDPELDPARASTPVNEHVGQGIHATIDGESVAIGRLDWIAGRGVHVTAADEAELDRLRADDLSPVVMSRGNRIVGLAGIGDPLQPDAAACIEALRARGWRPEILSGDDPVVVRRTGERLGIRGHRCRGGASPEQKLARVQRLARRAPVVLVGDGVNDAAALAAATCGVAVHGGAEASLQAADVYLDRPGLSGVVELIDGSARTATVIRRNLSLSLAYNVVGIALAMAGRIDPIVAAILMPASSLTVVVASYRARTFRPSADSEESDSKADGLASINHPAADSVTAAVTGARA
ncbi:MAG: heavy metal translocating P-type ATPase [Phycisphaerales bacterium]